MILELYLAFVLKGEREDAKSNTGERGTGICDSWGCYDWLLVLGMCFTRNLRGGV